MKTALVGSTRIELLRGDITAQAVDAIVNAANSSLLGGGGADGAIHRKGGPEILDECRSIIARIGRCRTGEAVATGAGRLPAKMVVHTVGPVWRGGGDSEDVLLARCFTRSLEVAVERGARTVAFPAISTGAYGYPIPEAAAVSLDAVAAFIHAHPDSLDLVRVVLFHEADLQAWDATGPLVRWVHVLEDGTERLVVDLLWRALDRGGDQTRVRPRVDPGLTGDLLEQAVLVVHVAAMVTPLR